MSFWNTTNTKNSNTFMMGVSNNNKIAIISYKKIGFKKLKLSEARLIKKSKNMDIYVFNISSK